MDASDPQRLENIEQVNSVLDEIGANEIPRIMVMNKIDRLEGMKPHLDKNEQGQVERVWVSALTGEGLEELQAALRNRLGQGHDG